MRLKNPLNFGLWDFYIGEESDKPEDVLRIPVQGYASSKKQLVNLVAATFESFAAQGKPEYKEAATSEAELMKLPYQDYLGKIIEHQLCIRHGGVAGGKCYPSGIGDRFHAFVKKVEKTTDKSPNIIQRGLDKIVGLITKQPKEKTTIQEGRIVRTTERRRLGGCGSCGGRTMFSRKGRNMGRAGRMQ